MRDKERMEEFWVVIAAYPNYSVSNYGNVRNNRTGRDLKPKVGTDGYVRVQFTTKQGYKDSCLVHRLVAAAFFKNFTPSLQVKHLNGVKHDNAVVNLTLVPRRARRRQL